MHEISIQSLADVALHILFWQNSLSYHPSLSKKDTNRTHATIDDLTEEVRDMSRLTEAGYQYQLNGIGAATKYISDNGLQKYGKLVERLSDKDVLFLQDANDKVTVVFRGTVTKEEFGFDFKEIGLKKGGERRTKYYEDMKNRVKSGLAELGVEQAERTVGHSLGGNKAIFLADIAHALGAANR